MLVVVGFPRTTRLSSKHMKQGLRWKMGRENLTWFLPLVLLNGDYNTVYDDIVAVVHESQQADALVKVISKPASTRQRSCRPARLQKRRGSICNTPTGFSSQGATPEARIMLETVDGRLGKGEQEFETGMNVQLLGDGLHANWCW